MEIGIWAITLREHAGLLEKAADDFEAFSGTDTEEHAENLRDAARQFREDAAEYVKMHSERTR
tara:strand:- start:405 stop:593 length:189 start_codon:yes stop_codon:yes gene_type:complete